MRFIIYFGLDLYISKIIKLEINKEPRAKHANIPLLISKIFKIIQINQIMKIFKLNIPQRM